MKRITVNKSDNEGNERIPLTHFMAAKVTAFVLVIIMSVAAAGSALAAAVMIDERMYTVPESRYRENRINDIAVTDAGILLDNLEDSEDAAEDYAAGRNIASADIFVSYADEDDEDNEKSEKSENNVNDTEWSYSSGRKAGSAGVEGKWYKLRYDDTESGTWYSRELDEADRKNLIYTAEVKLCIADELTVKDNYYFTDRIITLAYALKYWIYAIGICALIIAVSAFVFLMCASGRKKGFEEAQPGWAAKVPFDIITIAAVSAGSTIAVCAYEAGFYASEIECILLSGTACIALMCIITAWSMSFAGRIKLGKWWQNTVVYHLLVLAKKGLRILWKYVCRLCRALLSLAGNIPLIWKTALFMSVLTAAEFIVIMSSYYDTGILAGFFIFKSLIIVPLVIYIALVLRRLQKGGQALASGDLSYQVDTGKMLWDFRQHGEDLNSIAEGMASAVEQRLKSERMKTELITNVSHDIKTPLTSIINYADLIEKEKCDNPAITEYAEVLHRQSERLKRLIDDLVEASKASTGNLDIVCAPCDAGVMLAQTAGEYDEKLKSRELQLIINQPEQPVKIMADGRRLWRVFDNLMNNICKYAQNSTRVYLTLEEKNGQAVISFKNISHEPLNLSPDELLERFVQGDRSRNSEGSGLGLSIAKSLVELQNGTMELTTDGDLFKVVLRFPSLPKYTG